jgi:hypothetical protein
MLQYLAGWIGYEIGTNWFDRTVARKRQRKYALDFKERTERYLAWAKQHPEHMITCSVEAELEAIYANLRLSESQRLALVDAVLENGYRLMCELEAP